MTLPVPPGPVFRHATAEDCGRLLTDLLPTIDRLASWAGRRQGLGEELDDLVAWVHLRLVERDYKILRAYCGTSKLETYLASVVINLARDYRVSAWGRFRPSAVALRLGEVAIRVETLLHRDGRALDEVVSLLTATRQVTADEVREVAALLPARTATRLEGAEQLATVPAAERAEERLEAATVQATEARTREVLTAGLRALEVQDRLILKLHFCDGLTLAAVARGLRLDQRAIYPRVTRSLRQLRKTFEEQGLAAGDVLAAAGWAGASLKLDPTDEDLSLCPSHSREDEASRGSAPS